MGREFDIRERSSITDICGYESTALEYEGFFYIIDLDGESVKIGSTARPSKRMGALLHTLKDYANMDCSRVFVSEPHINYKQNETKLLNYFTDKRRPSTEICLVAYDDAVGAIKNCVDIKRASQEYLNERARRCDGVKRLLMSALGYESQFERVAFFKNETYASMFSFILSMESLTTKDELMYFLDVIEKDKERWLSLFANSFQSERLMRRLVELGVVGSYKEFIDYYDKEYCSKVTMTLLGIETTQQK